MKEIIFLVTDVKYENEPMSLSIKSPNIIMYGNTMDGKPLKVIVDDFIPYMYVETAEEINPNKIEDIIQKFDKAKCLGVKKVMKKSIYGYQPDKKVFYQVFLNDPGQMRSLASWMKTVGIAVKTYESGYSHVLRFMNDMKITGMSYVRVKIYEEIGKGKYYKNNKINKEIYEDSKKSVANNKGISSNSQIDKGVNHKIICKFCNRYNCDCKGPNWDMGIRTLRTGRDMLVPLEIAGDYMKVPPLKILSFDIECCSKDNTFPQSSRDPVIQIGNVVHCFGSNEMRKEIFCLGETGDIPGAVVRWYNHEEDLLAAWKDFVIQEDPDVIIGYNITGFDFPYLFGRAAALKIDGFTILGRSKRPGRIVNKQQSSSAFGAFDAKEISIDGRLIIDMLHVIRREYRLRSYSLNSVSFHFLGEQKEDVSYSSMYGLQNGNKETRRRIASYCLKDAYLPVRLFDRLNILINYTELARVTHVPIAYFTSRGAAIKVLAQIYWEAGRNGYIVPDMDMTKGELETYEGAFVMDPIRGFYANPVAVLDFSSLYPSIIISKNLCYTTLLTSNSVNCNTVNVKNNSVDCDNAENSFNSSENDYDGSENNYDSIESDNYNNYKSSNKLDITNYSNINKGSEKDKTSKIFDIKNNVPSIRTPTNDYFCTKDVHEGLVPRILKELLAARKETKNQLSKTQDEWIKRSLNGRQLALKICANSIYGFTGASAGQLPCIEISRSTTAFGRDMIAKTKNVIESTYCIKNGYNFDAQVIYGDTDSVMINFIFNNSIEELIKSDKDGDHKTDKNKEIKDEAYKIENKDHKNSNVNAESILIRKICKIAKEIALTVSNTFIKPISLEFEKIYCPYLLMNKKRYAGLIYTNKDTPDKIDTKGIETVRRDNCELVKDVVERCLYKILYNKDITGAVNDVKRVVQDLYMGNVDLSKLVITKTYTKSTYTSKQAHTELMEKLKKRGIQVGIGERIPYVIIKGDKKSPAYEKSEDPVYVLENSLEIDIKYYIDQQLKKPIYRLFEPIMDNISDIFNGEHTKIIRTTGSPSGPLNSFIRRIEYCVGCKKPGSIICDHCRLNFPYYFRKAVNAYNQKTAVFNACWVECQRCQGSIFNEVLCVNRICPIWYKRTKVKMDLKRLHDLIIKLGW